MDNRRSPQSGGVKNSALGQAWLVLLLALIFGVALASVQTQLSGVIAANKMNETLEKVPQLIWGDDAPALISVENNAVKIVPGSLEITAAGKSKVYPLFKVDQGGRLAGWVVKAGGQGYADKIELLVGLDPALASITGLFVLEQKETPGLGNKIVSADWRGQFPGKRTDTVLEVQKSGASAPNGIDAITGATISSRAVTTIVNQTLSGLRGQLTPDTFQPQER